MADFDGFIRVWQKEIESVTKQFSEINIRQSLDIMEEVAVYGAEQGWTIPLHTTMRESQELIHGKSKSEMDKAFEEHYSIEENYMEMKKRLTSNVLKGDGKSHLKNVSKIMRKAVLGLLLPAYFLY